jgi:hypothetical protein
VLIATSGSKATSQDLFRLLLARPDDDDERRSRRQGSNRPDTTSPILRGNPGEHLSCRLKVWVAGGVFHVGEDEPAPRTGAGLRRTP